MAAVLELVLREEVAVAAVVRWLLHGPGHRPAEVTRGASCRPLGFPSFPPPARPSFLPSFLRCAAGPCGKVCSGPGGGRSAPL
uniref:Uncharacterized protein n=1 Tax=Amazona collaria TaxID=241587 RepID=A0A8B9FHX0_9PSIT